MEFRFDATCCSTVTWVKKILTRAKSNVHAGRRFPTPGLQFSCRLQRSNNLDVAVTLCSAWGCICKPRAKKLYSKSSKFLARPDEIQNTSPLKKKKAICPHLPNWWKPGNGLKSLYKLFCFKTINACNAIGPLSMKWTVRCCLKNISRTLFGTWCLNHCFVFFDLSVGTICLVQLVKYRRHART